MDYTNDGDDISDSSESDHDEELESKSASSAEYYEKDLDEDNNDDELLQENPYDEGSDEDDLELQLPKSEKLLTLNREEYIVTEEEDDDDDEDEDEDQDEYDDEDVSDKEKEGDSGDNDKKDFFDEKGISLFHEVGKQFHPECMIHNNEEVETMSIVVRNEKGVIVDEFHKTLPFLTKYEKTKLLGLRVQQLNEGVQPLIKPAIGDSNFLIAQKELQEKKMPFIIRRLTPNGRYEYWKVEDLELLS